MEYLKLSKPVKPRCYFSVTKLKTDHCCRLCTPTNISFFCQICSNENIFNVSDYLKPLAEEERRVEEAEKKIREEQERIYKQLSEGNTHPGLLPVGSKDSFNSTREQSLYFGIVTVTSNLVYLVFSSCSKLRHYPQMNQFQTGVQMFQK